MLPQHQCDGLRVVLVSTRNPLNIGAAARAMGNFGFGHLRVVNPYNPSFREARSAVGSMDVLARAEQYTSVADSIADCSLVVGTSAIQHRDPAHRIEDVAAGTRLIRAHLHTGRVALLFGSEKRGLSNDDLSYCHWIVHIPTSEDHRSVNLGQAVAVCLYELARIDGTETSPLQTRTATALQLERITALLLDTLQSTGYFQTGLGLGSEMKLRRFVRRLNLDGSDAELLLGMLRQIAWKLNHK